MRTGAIQSRIDLDALAPAQAKKKTAMPGLTPWRRR
jgi:hypothetical protein